MKEVVQPQIKINREHKPDIQILRKEKALVESNTEVIKEINTDHSSILAQSYSLIADPGDDPDRLIRKDILCGNIMEKDEQKQIEVNKKINEVIYLETNPQKIFQSLITRINIDLKETQSRKEMKIDGEANVPTTVEIAHPVINFSRIKFKNFDPKKLKKKTFTKEDEHDLIEMMEGLCYSWTEIENKVDEKRKKYGIYNRSERIEKPLSEEEIKRRLRSEEENNRRIEVTKEMTQRWKKVKSEPFKQNTKNMFNWRLRPINGKELESAYVKQIRTHFNQNFVNLLTKKWEYNDRMGDCMWN
jgi:hypothetical protein